MSTYIPALIWVASAVFCGYVATKRGVRKTVVRTIFIALFGPFAIPFAFVIRPEKPVHSD